MLILAVRIILKQLHVYTKRNIHWIHTCILDQALSQMFY